MEKLVDELKSLIKFKDTTDIGDIVLIVTDNPQMLSYALVTDITRDTSKRAEWWHITMQVLAIPPQKTTWILRTPQMTGMEIFTMNGEKRFVKAVAFEDDHEKPVRKKEKVKKKKPQLRVVK
jgi:2-C-methyl-D-erythritol 4-phosphate cytidylyltransferase